MHFTVTASSKVLDQLALIWIEATDRDAITQAANEIDSRLRNSPLEHGEAHGDVRTLAVGPLKVSYMVSVDDCLVSIKEFVYEQEQS